jgi:hypothetical protein
MHFILCILFYALYFMNLIICIAFYAMYALYGNPKEL